ncbi:hypothetical protein STEG23_035264 [Scotinomys teguina]
MDVKSASSMAVRDCTARTNEGTVFEDHRLPALEVYVFSPTCYMLKHLLVMEQEQLAVNYKCKNLKAPMFFSPISSLYDNCYQVKDGNRIIVRSKTCQLLTAPIYFREDMGIEEPADGVNFHCGKTLSLIISWHLFLLGEFASSCSRAFSFDPIDLSIGESGVLKSPTINVWGLIPSLLLCLPPCVLRLTGNFYILSSWRSGVFSSCCLALDSSSSFPCPAFRAIAKSPISAPLSAAMCSAASRVTSTSCLHGGLRLLSSCLALDSSSSFPCPPSAAQISWNLPSSAFCRAGFVDRLGLFIVSPISWTFCFMTFLDLVFSLTDESISSINFMFHIKDFDPFGIGFHTGLAIEI